MALPIPRTLFTEEHETFRATARRFMEAEVAPHMERWMAQGHPDRDVWLKAGELGFLCCTVAPEYGGSGADRLYSAILIEEQQRVNSVGPGFALHSDIVAPYLSRIGTGAQKRQWLPRMARGELIGAIAMTEPGAGSDLKNITTSAVFEGDQILINGSKTFITNGYLADLVIVAVKTDPRLAGKGLSLVLVDTDRPGFRRGRPLAKIGQKAQDTCELFFENVRVPRSHLLGERGEGFAYLMQELPWERLINAIRAVAAAEFAVDVTVRYTKERRAFGKPVLDFQSSRFRLAECQTQVQMAQVFVDRCLELVTRGALDAQSSAMAKWWCSEMQNRVIDACLQLHGGYGYMSEYPIARAFVDARAQMLYAGTNEIMKEIIGRQL